ncbi:putative two-component response regulator ARR13 isoform X1 [Lycium barbarum]|uniref:putative two-component response regulator ARR13 isoform X1 n=1 Tax=Lycium barbarum TaxID=112863 RepID=UPI00293E1993|nr:putative two-component response regulator ARR13 isoform X1 [Lycium barbarum]
MGGEMLVANKSREIIDSEFVETTNIMVVDDDTTCLCITAALLKKYKYKVVTVKSAKDALYVLRIKGDSFDLVVIDVHMPEMNGFELQQVIAKEFDIPVVFMSADEKHSTTLKGLEGGAVFFIQKPISPDDVQDIWQYAIRRKRNKIKGKSLVIKEIHDNTDSLGKSASGPRLKSPNHEVIVVESSASINEKGNEESNNEISSERHKSARKHEEDKKEDNETTTSKKKLVWTSCLHNKFLAAISELGLENAYPMRILEVMNVPHLTRENVASHLQKYRIFLRKVTQESFGNQTIVKDAANSTSQSTSPSNRPSQFPPENSGLQQHLSLKNRLYKSPEETSNCGSSSFLNRLAITFPEYGQPDVNDVSNQLSTTEATNNISTHILNAATSAQQFITGNLNSPHNSSGADTEPSQGIDYVAGGVTSFKSHQSLSVRESSFIELGDEEYVEMWTHHIANQEARTQLPSLPNNDGSGAGGSGYVQPELVSNKGDSSKVTFSNANQFSAREATDNISTQLLNAVTSADQQLITGNLNSLHYSFAADRETNQQNERAILTGHINQKATVELPPLPESFGGGAGGSGTTLNPYYDFSMYRSVNPRPNSSGIGDLTNTLSSQLNAQPYNVENKDDEGTTLNFNDGINQYQQVYFPWTGHTVAEAS